MNKLKTSEMVCKGHPDKLCDYIADSILDDYLSHDKDSRVAVEVAVSYKRVFIFGEVTSKYKIKNCEALEYENNTLHYQLVSVYYVCKLILN